MKKSILSALLVVGMAVLLLTTSLLTVAGIQSYALAHDAGPQYLKYVDQNVPLAQATREKFTAATMSVNGVTQTLAAPSAVTMAFSNNGFVWVTGANISTTARTITFETPGNIGGLEIEDKAVEIPDETTFNIGPFIGSLYNRKVTPDKGYVYITFPETDSFTVGVYKLQ